MEGTADPDSEKCVEIATKAALKKMMLPGVIAVAMPAVVGFGLGAMALGGMLAGGLLGCVALAYLWQMLAVLGTTLRSMLRRVTLVEKVLILMLQLLWEIQLVILSKILLGLQ